MFNHSQVGNVVQLLSYIWRFSNSNCHQYTIIYVTSIYVTSWTLIGVQLPIPHHCLTYREILSFVLSLKPKTDSVILCVKVGYGEKDKVQLAMCFGYYTLYVQAELDEVNNLYLCTSN